ncbi:hypothetical protein RFI_04868 [Reticulomyxa filosa]|uniref:Uncharacterized protein n=1 Tax=Reticulomyxa filosa TaxID=46433 RepID=X6P200_RETFI|nr:hypothetical protein RFI_04868 [Reticulomyxa filosa]|eukprot:ETO32251.1 hypothetical protein RFI_04868 [Reticulomyxa filosa]
MPVDIILLLVKFSTVRKIEFNEICRKDGERDITKLMSKLFKDNMLDHVAISADYTDGREYHTFLSTEPINDIRSESIYELKFNIRRQTAEICMGITALASLKNLQGNSIWSDSSIQNTYYYNTTINDHLRIIHNSHGSSKLCECHCKLGMNDTLIVELDCMQRESGKWLLSFKRNDALLHKNPIEIQSRILYRPLLVMRENECYVEVFFKVSLASQFLFFPCFNVSWHSIKNIFLFLPKTLVLLDKIRLAHSTQLKDLYLLHIHFLHTPDRSIFIMFSLICWMILLVCLPEQEEKAATDTSTKSKENEKSKKKFLKLCWSKIIIVTDSCCGTIISSFANKQNDVVLK